MAFELSECNGHLAVSGEMNIYSAETMKNALLPAVRNRGGDAVLNLAAATEIDTAGLQVILMLRRLARACGGRFVLIEPSPSVSEVLEICGLSSAIERSSEATAGTYT